jgi:4-amino-4-deoxy-L-arabinose transferase-like glycosyltransferase
MSDVATRAPSARPRGFPLRAGVRAHAHQDTYVLGALALALVALAALTWGTWGDLSMDTGYDLVAASRTADGELPYVDYVYFYGPLGPVLLAAVYGITGPAVWPAVALGLLLAVAAVWLTYRLAREFVAPLPAGIAAALVASTALSAANNSYVLPHTLSAPLALVLALGALLTSVRWARSDEDDERGRLVVAGTLAGLAAISRPELAAALYVALTAWLLVRVWRPGRATRTTALGDAAALAVPALAIPGLVYGYFAVRVGVGDLLFENLYPTDYLREAGNVVLRLHAPWTAGSFAELAGSVLLYGAGVAALFGCARVIDAGGTRRRLVLLALAGGALLFLLVLVAKPDTVRFYLRYAYAWVPAGAWIAAGVLIWSIRRGRTEARAALLPVLLLAVAATTTYAQFTPFPNLLHPDATAFLMPLAAVFLAWLHVSVVARRSATAAKLGVAWLAVLAVANAGLVVADAREDTTTVRGPGGALAARAADGPALQAALDAVARYTRPGEPVLLAPQMTALYVMGDRPNPLPQLSLLPGTLTGAQDEQDAIARLGDVRLAVVDRTPQSTYEHGAFGTTFAPRIGAWLRANFDLVTTARGAGPTPRVVDIWIRRSP